MLAQIKNAYQVNKKSLQVPYSKQKLKIAQILADHNFLGGVSEKKVKGSKVKKNLKLDLVYDNAQPAIQKIIRVSKPSCRRYSSAGKLPVVLSGFGIAIVSTNKGLMTAYQAKKQNLGGELICKVY